MIKEYRKSAGLTQRQFSDLFGIPIDVVKSWDSGRRSPPEWAEKLIIYKFKRMETEMKKYSDYYDSACEAIGSNGYRILDREKYRNVIAKTVITKYANGFGEISWLDSEGRTVAEHIGTLDNSYPRIGEILERMKEQ